MKSVEYKEDKCCTKLSPGDFKSALSLFMRISSIYVQLKPTNVKIEKEKLFFCSNVEYSLHFLNISDK
jgi:hypothetical protein